MLRNQALLSIISVAAYATSIELASFDGAKATTFNFKEMNDPVMGGKSTGTWRVDTSGQFGVFDGEVVDVPSLKAPGFIKAAADGKFADVSSAFDGDLVLTVRSTTPEYQGFRVSFFSGFGSAQYSCAGGGGIPFSRGCFKAQFSVPAGSDFVAVRIPFNKFSDKWSSYTGDQTKKCADDSSVCPTTKILQAIKRVEVWAEGVSGKVHLEVQSIFAMSHSQQEIGLGARPPSSVDTCSGPVQKQLLYGIAGRTEPTVPVPVEENETLAEAVCCDSRVMFYAEPQFLFDAPDIQLFSKLKDGVTTFYDSVCGVPLFKAPVGRTMAEFKADTEEHGWPSFRSAEVIAEHVNTNKTTGFVTSSCGTHLGSYLPDDKGPRWCMDLSCIAGTPKTIDMFI